MAFFGSKASTSSLASASANPLAQDVEVTQGPTDSTSALAWSPVTDYLAVSSWDNQVRIYEASQAGAQGRAAYSHEAPALDVCWSKDGTKVFSGGVDNAGRMYDVQTGTSSQVAQHDAPVKSTRWTDMHGGLLVTGSWDKTVKYWDLRTPNPIGTIQLPERCYSMDTQQRLLVIGMAERQLMVIDLNNPTAPSAIIESPLKFQTRCVAVSPDATMYAVGGVEGRTAVQFINPVKPTSDNYSFRCHRAPDKDQRQKDGSVAHIYALNDMAFHPVHGTCVTAGSDGCMSSWDLNNKKLLKNFDLKTVNTQSQSLPVSAVAFNNINNSTRLAYAVSYDWAHGYKGNHSNHPNKIMIHTVKDEEVRKKPK